MAPRIVRLLVSCVCLAAIAQCATAAELECPNDEDMEDLAEFFPGVGNIPYEGPDSRNPLAYHYYNANEPILGKPMREWLRFSVAFWHTLRGDGSDMFGSATKMWPWEREGDSELQRAYRRMQALFEFINKLGVDYWCFHDRDIAPEGATLSESNANLDKVAALAGKLQQMYGKRVLWGTAQLFKHPRYMHGAATSPNPFVFAYAAAQVKKAMEVTHHLGGQAYVFWGGREGYHSLINTNLRLELDNLATFMSLAAEYNEEKALNLSMLLEPKPQEPTKHQYDWDAATTMSFLHQYSLTDKFKLNIECNHATLAGHSCEHELRMASAYGMLGSFDANTGDAQTGWDTDQFLTDPREATLAMLTIVQQGGLAPGGINFDAKLRRESTDVLDLFYAHIGGMDALARGLRNAAAIIEDGTLPRLLEERYANYTEAAPDERAGLLGRAIRQRKVSLEDLEAVVEDLRDEPGSLLQTPSARVEMMENILSTFIR